MSIATEFRVSLGADCSRSQASVILSHIYEDEIFNVLHLKGARSLSALTYTRGVSLPLFRGSSGHITLAHLDRRQLRRLFDRSLQSGLGDDVRAIGSNWEEFCKALRRIRKAGYYVSRGEIDAGATGIAAPIFGVEREIMGSLVVVYETARCPRTYESALVPLVKDAAANVSRQLHLFANEDTVLTGSHPGK